MFLFGAVLGYLAGLLTEYAFMLRSLDQWCK